MKPYWISINQQDQSIQISTEFINKIFNTYLIFSAKLFTISNDDSITTSNYTTKIYFKNSNWKFVSGNFSNYLVINKISKLVFLFQDEEDDNVIVKVEANQSYNAFVEYPNSTSVTIIMQANESKQRFLNFSFSYTDYYHQEAEYWLEYNISLSLFTSEPPYFNESLSSIKVSRWADAQYILPDVIDLNNEIVTIRLGEDTPNWIQIQDNSIISILSKSSENIDEGSIEVTVILENESSAWKKYSLNIIIMPVYFPTFGNIPDINITKLTDSEKYLFIISYYEVNVVECNSDSIIEWITYNNSYLKLNDNFNNKLNSRKKCVRLSSYDSWKNIVYSNPFNIYNSLINRPPALLNSMGPFSIAIGKYYLFEIPIDMFDDYNGVTLTYNASVVSWSQNKLF